MDRHRFNPTRIQRALDAPAGATSDYDLNPDKNPGARGRGARLRPASVLVPLVERGPELRVILTRRAARLKHHPGQVAFPGGKQEPGDPTALDAALREAREEIGLMPAQVEVLGAFDLHETVTNFRVTPFVGLVAAGFAPVADRAEVDEVFEVPLGFLLAPSNFQVHGRHWQGVWRRYHAIPYGPHYIWGATARILKTLAERMREP
jgi:8-oxo-dGTP pyrophosphatase MutT (NUDIX family)